jgi:hypothetical protein
VTGVKHRSRSAIDQHQPRPVSPFNRQYERSDRPVYAAHMCRYGRLVVATPTCSASEQIAGRGLSDGSLGSVQWPLAMRRQRFFDRTS